MFLIEKLFESYNLISATKAKVRNTLKQSTMNNKEEDDIYLLASKGSEIIQFQISPQSSEIQSYKVIASLKYSSFILGLNSIPQQYNNQASYVIILCENLEILVVTFYNDLENDKIMLKDHQIHAIQLQCNVSWCQFVDLQVTHNSIFVQHSNTQFTIIPYNMIDGVPEFQLNFISYTEDFSPLQIIPYNVESQKIPENAYSFVVFYQDESNDIKIAQTLAVSNAPIQLDNLQPITTILKSSFWRAFVLKSGILIHLDKRLIIIKRHNQQVTLMKNLVCSPRQILEINSNEFLFQNGYMREIYLVNISQVEVTCLGVFSYAEKMEFVNTNVIFISSTLDDSQILYLDQNRVVKVVNLKNLGKVTHLSKDHINTQITSCLSRYSAQGLSRQVKMKALVESRQFDKPLSLVRDTLEISNYNILKAKIHSSYTIAVTDDNNLLVIQNGSIINQRQFEESISDFDVKNNEIFISFWFSNSIQIVDCVGLQNINQIAVNIKGSHNVSTFLEGQVGTNNTTIKGLMFFQQCLFIANLEDQLVVLQLDHANQIIKQDNYCFTSSFIKFVECAKHVIVIYSDKLCVFIKESLHAGSPQYFQINKTHVYDASVQDAEQGYLLNTLVMNHTVKLLDGQVKQSTIQVYSLEEFDFQESIGSQTQETLQNELNQNIEFQETSESLTFIIKNQIIYEFEGQTHAVSKFQAANYRLKDVTNQQRQSILLVCSNQPQYWQNTLIQSHTLLKSDTTCFKVHDNKTTVKLFMAGKNFEATKKGFFKVMIFSPTGVFIDEKIWMLADSVTDIGVQSENQIWLLTEKKTILVSYQNIEGKFNQNLVILSTVVDQFIVPSRIQVRQDEFIIYDDLKSLSLYSYDAQSNKVTRQLSQMFDGYNWRIKFLGDYILRIGFDHTIQIYQKEQQKNYQSLKKIGFGDLHEDVLSIHINDKDCSFLFGTKQGSVYQGMLLKQDQIVAIMEVQDQIKKLKIKKQIIKSQMEEEKALALEAKIELVKQISIPVQSDFVEPQLHKSVSAKVKGESRGNQQNESLLYLKKLFKKKIDAVENCFFTYQDLSKITMELEFQEVFDSGSIQSFQNAQEFQDLIEQLKIMIK